MCPGGGVGAGGLLSSMTCFTGSGFGGSADALEVSDDPVLEASEGAVAQEVVATEGAVGVGGPSGAGGLPSLDEAGA